MEYRKSVTLKNGKTCLLRNGTQSDGKSVLDVFNRTHAQTDFLLTYPEENSFTAEDEGKYLKAKTESENEIEILATVDNVIAGTAGIEAVGAPRKVSHRATFGVGIDKAYWGLGIGQALTDACIECAKKAGYKQIELDVVSDNKSAIHIYKKAGFVEFGVNPRGFLLKDGSYQELIHMYLKL